MLTLSEVQSAKIRGVLIPYVPPMAAIGTKRAFLMSKTLSDEISKNRQSIDTKVITRWASLEGDILHFIQGGYINRHLFKHLDPKKFEHWCLRSIRPKPSLRVFGRFARPNVFVGTHAVERPSLKEKWNFQWEFNKLFCENDIWEKECGLPNRPFSGDKYTDYITENANEDLEIK